MTTNFLKRWSERKSLQNKAVELSETTEAATEWIPEKNDHDPQQMSVAELLTSEVSESLKKAALKKLFLSPEFNVRDGLDDYDDDYHNLTSLSEEVADTLRNWIADKEEEVEENLHIPEHQTTDCQVTNNEAKAHDEVPHTSPETVIPEKTEIAKQE